MKRKLRDAQRGENSAEIEAERSEMTAPVMPSPSKGMVCVGSIGTCSSVT